MPTQVVKMGGNGTYTQFTATAGTKWEAVQVTGGEKIYGNTGNKYSATLLGTDIALIDPGAVIVSCAARFNIMKTGTNQNMRMGWYLGATDEAGTWYLPPTDPTYEWKPATGYETIARPGGGQWAYADLSSLEMICEANTGGTGYYYCDCMETQITWSYGPGVFIFGMFSTILAAILSRGIAGRAAPHIQHVLRSNPCLRNFKPRKPLYNSR